MDTQMIMVFINGVIRMWWLWLILGAFAALMWKTPNRPRRGRGKTQASKAHQDFMAQTSGAPTSNGCISPVYLSNNQDRDHF